MLSNTGTYKLFENTEAAVIRQQNQPQMMFQPLMQQLPGPMQLPGPQKKS
jgi:hypothetical protein